MEVIASSMASMAWCGHVHEAELQLGYTRAVAFSSAVVEASTCPGGSS
jgi:hypothetical protein